MPLAGCFSNPASALTAFRLAMIPEYIPPIVSGHLDCFVAGWEGTYGGRHETKSDRSISGHCRYGASQSVVRQALEGACYLSSLSKFGLIDLPYYGVVHSCYSTRCCACAAVYTSSVQYV